MALSRSWVWWVPKPPPPSPIPLICSEMSMSVVWLSMNLLRSALIRSWTCVELDRVAEVGLLVREVLDEVAELLVERHEEVRELLEVLAELLVVLEASG